MWRRPAPLLLGAALLVTVLFTYLALRDVRFGETWRVLRTSGYWWLAPAFVLLGAGIVLRALRWRLLFPAETRPSIRAVTSATLIGYLFNNVLPARAGEVARVIALYQRAGTSRAETAATVVVERAIDVVSLLGLFFIALPWLPDVTWLRAVALAGLAVALILGAAVAVLAVFGDRPLVAALRPLGRLRFLTPDRVENATRDLGRGLAGLRDLGQGLAVLALTVLSWLVLALSSWVLMLGFDLDLAPAAGLLVLVAVGVAWALPAAPGAVGTFEAAAVAALAAYGVSGSHALAYALVLHALNLVPFILAGTLALHEHALAVRRRTRAVGACL